MWYIFIRIIIGFALVVVATITIRRSRLRKKKLITICSFIAIIIATSLSHLLPVENLFVRFSSPERAFEYSVNGTISEVVTGEHSALVLYRINDSVSIAVLPRDDRGWKIGTYFSYDEVFSETVNRRTINVYNAKNTNDFYILIKEPLATDIATITDSNHSAFQSIWEENEMLGTKDILYYAYVQDMNDNYSIIIDGEPITFSSFTYGENQ